MCRQQMKATCGVPAYTDIYFICFKIFCPETTLTTSVFPQHFTAPKAVRTATKILIKRYSSCILRFVVPLRYRTASLNERKLSVSQFRKFFPTRMHFLLRVAVKSQVIPLNICSADTIWYRWDRDKTSQVNYQPVHLKESLNTLEAFLNIYKYLAQCANLLLHQNKQGDAYKY